ncbi:hypothetical protein [Sphingopyxis sp.]|uniref:hypothetical protein n=1 Tax=Sphingopyxis sp. TaxID=1908224 RepID=UPI00258CA863|nr:hypothetical protein [Sphingopyxis sp.]
MDDVPNNPWTLVRALYLFAAIFGLCAAYFWMRFASAQSERRLAGGPVSIRWLMEAGIGTGLALSCAAGGYIASMLL